MMDDTIQSNNENQHPEGRGEFVQLLSANYRKLLGYIVSLVGSRQDAEDILQRCSLSMWQKYSTFEPGTDFMAWASTFAFYESKNFLRLVNRARLIFSDETINLLSEERAKDLDFQNDRLAALESCLQELSPPHRALIAEAYTEHANVLSIAKARNLAPQTLYNRLHLIRKSLANCVRRKLSVGGTT
jgi:RNA polymerase sigma-70 factor, ECF subfamily